MIYLNQISPAEILILTRDSVTQSELLKVTLIDLLLKNVLKITDVHRQPNIRQKIKTFKYISIGNNFTNYKAKDHENYFLSPFQRDATIEILFRNLVKLGYQNSGNLSNIKNSLVETPKLVNCFSQNIFQMIVRKYSLTDDGKDMKQKVKKEIETVNKEFPDLHNIESKKAVDLIKIIGANIFLLDNIDYDLLHQIDADLATEINKKESAYEGTVGCFGCGNTYNSYSSNFDSGCSSDSGSSGCSSGCGGCGGGCGGCSGCS